MSGIGMDDATGSAWISSNVTGLVYDVGGLAPAQNSFSIADRTVTEGDAGMLNANFRITLAAPAATQTSVRYATANGTAAAPADFQAGSGTVTFAPGQTTRNVSVPIKGDLLDEPNETFAVTLANAQGAAIGDGVATGRIVDQDPAPALSVADASRVEGFPLSFAITLSGPSGRTVRVGVATSDGSAVAPGDYAARTATVTFQPGETVKQFTVMSAGDSLDEPNETLGVTLSSPVAATIADGSATGTVVDND
jgi:chitinase